MILRGILLLESAGRLPALSIMGWGLRHRGTMQLRSRLRHYTDQSDGGSWARHQGGRLLPAVRLLCPLGSPPFGRLTLSWNQIATEPVHPADTLVSADAEAAWRCRATAWHHIAASESTSPTLSINSRFCVAEHHLAPGMHLGVVSVASCSRAPSM